MAAVYVYEGKKTGRDTHKFTHLQTRAEKLVDNLANVSGFEYVEVAEVVTRAQYVPRTCTCACTCPDRP